MSTLTSMWESLRKSFPNQPTPQRIKRRIMGAENECMVNGILVEGHASATEDGRQTMTENAYKTAAKEVLFPKEEQWRISKNTTAQQQCFYRDQGKIGFEGLTIERSTPECIGAREVALRETASLKILADAATKLRNRHPTNFGKVSFHKTDRNCKLEKDAEGRTTVGLDHCGSSHGNYLTFAWVRAEDIRNIDSFLLTRYSTIGNGWLEITPQGFLQYVLSQRAGVIGIYENVSSSNPAPLIGLKGFTPISEGTLSVSYANHRIWRRYHDPSENQNMSEVQIFLKRGVMDLMLILVETGNIIPPPAIRDKRFEKAASPIVALTRFFNSDIFGQRKVRLANDEYWSANDFQRYWISQVELHFEKNKSACTYERREVLDLWKKVIKALEEKDLETLARILDWAGVLYYLLMPRLEKLGLDPMLIIYPTESEGIRFDRKTTVKKGEQTLISLFLMLLVEYADADTSRSPYGKLLEHGFMDRLFSPEEVRLATEAPPRNTRANYREELMQCLHQLPDMWLASLRWDEIVVAKPNPDQMIASYLTEIKFTHNFSNPYLARVRQLGCELPLDPVRLFERQNYP